MEANGVASKPWATNPRGRLCAPRVLTWFLFQSTNMALNPEALETELKKKKIRLVYVTPLHQYPTTVTMPVSRGFGLRSCAKYGCPYSKMTTTNEYHYSCQPLPPLAASDPEGLIIYISTFSKVAFPSARLGFMAVPKSLARPLGNFRRIVTRQNDCFLQDAVPVDAIWSFRATLAPHTTGLRGALRDGRSSARPS